MCIRDRCSVFIKRCKTLHDVAFRSFDFYKIRKTLLDITFNLNSFAALYLMGLCNGLLLSAKTLYTIAFNACFIVLGFLLRSNATSCDVSLLL